MYIYICNRCICLCIYIYIYMYILISVLEKNESPT